MRRLLTLALVASLATGCTLARAFFPDPAEEERRMERQLRLFQVLQPQPAARAPDLTPRLDNVEGALREVLGIIRDLARRVDWLGESQERRLRALEERR